MAYISTGDVKGMLGGKSSTQRALDTIKGNLESLQEQAAPKKGFLEQGLDWFKGVGEKLASIPGQIAHSPVPDKADMTYTGPGKAKAAGVMGISPVLLLGGAALMAYLVLKKKK